MKNILQNPYRIIGVLVNSNDRERINQVNKLKKYLMAGKNIEDDYSFPCIGLLERDIDILEKAEKDLYRGEERIKHALFWFYRGNPIIDDVVFDKMKNGNINEVIEIWNKLLTNITDINNITEKNFSIYQNYSTLCLCFYSRNKNRKINILKQALILKLYFLQSSFGEDFLKKIGGEKSVSIEEAQMIFLKEIDHELDLDNEKKDILLQLLDKENFRAKTTFFEYYINKQISRIENELENLKGGKITLKDILNIAEKLSKRVNEIRGYNILTEKINWLSNRISEKILQISIDNFNSKQEGSISNQDFELIIRLVDIATSLSTTELTRQRCIENKKILESNKVFFPIREDIAYIAQQIEETMKSPSIDSAEKLLKRCQPRLQNIRKTLGPRCEEYLKISTGFVVALRNMLVEVVNSEQNRFLYHHNVRAIYNTIKRAYDLHCIIEQMDMPQNLKNILIEDKKTLIDLKKKVSPKSILFLSIKSILSSLILRIGTFFMVFFILFGIIEIINSMSAEKKDLSSTQENVVYIDQQFQECMKSPSIDSAESFIKKCQPKLENIKNKLGSGSKEYLEISNNFVSAARTIIVEVVNNEIQRLQFHKNIFVTCSIVKRAYNLYSIIEQMDMKQDLENKIIEDKKTLLGILFECANAK